MKFNTISEDIDDNTFDIDGWSSSQIIHSFEQLIKSVKQINEVETAKKGTTRASIINVRNSRCIKRE